MPKRLRPSRQITAHSPVLDDRRRRPRNLTFTALAAGIAAGSQFGAYAQEATPGTVQTVTVTAERRSENILAVPNSVTSLSGESLEVLGSSGEDVRQLAGRAPSLNIESSFGRAFPRFYIRGLGNTDFDLNASQPVSLVLDDVVQENPILKGFPMFDIGSVEVLRGPQGTLFGRNAPAGVVKFNSVEPSNRQEGYASFGYGRFGTMNIEGAYNVPITEEIAGRISVLYQKRDDWVDNTYPGAVNSELEGYEDMAARAQVKWTPHRDFQALFNLHGRHLNGTARVFRANIFKPGTNDLVDDFEVDQVSLDGRNEQKLDSWGGSMRLRWNLSNDLTLHSITGYETVDAFSRGDIDGGYGASFLGAGNYGPGEIPFTAESADGLPQHRQITQEFRLESNMPGPFNWQGGIYYFDEKVKIESINYDTLAGGVQNGYATQHQQNKAWAAFGSVNYDLTSDLQVRAGLRYTHDEKDFTAYRLEAPPFSPTFLGSLDTSTSDDNVSGDIALRYTIAPDTNVYTRFATGYRAPSIQGRLLFDDQISKADSEKVTSFEIGGKSDFWNKRAQISGAVFYYQIKDQQLTAVGGGSNVARLLNADKSVGKGAEVDIKAWVTEQLLLTASASYNHTEIKDSSIRLPGCGGGCTMLDPSDADGYIIDGNPLPQSPRTMFNVAARYGIPMRGTDELYFYTDWAYRSKINFFLYESAEFTGKSLLTGGLRVGYIFGDGKYEGALWVRNITDEVQAVGGIDFNNLTGFVNEPRTYGVSFKANF